jgi:hypothetical protein
MISAFNPPIQNMPGLLNEMMPVMKVGQAEFFLKVK